MLSYLPIACSPRARATLTAVTLILAPGHLVQAKQRPAAPTRSRFSSARRISTPPKEDRGQPLSSPDDISQDNSLASLDEAEQDEVSGTFTGKIDVEGVGHEQEAEVTINGDDITLDIGERTTTGKINMLKIGSFTYVNVRLRGRRIPINLSLRITQVGGLRIIRIAPGEKGSVELLEDKPKPSPTPPPLPTLPPLPTPTPTPRPLSLT